MQAALALSTTYTAAQEVVEFLKRGDWDQAFVRISEFTGPDQAEVATKAIALGADPDAIKTMLASLQTEVIEVTGEAPKPARQIPWFWILLAALAIGGALYYKRKKRG